MVATLSWAVQTLSDTGSLPADVLVDQQMPLVCYEVLWQGIVMIVTKVVLNLCE